MKILVIRFSSLGDLILTTPVYRALKQCYPEAHVTLLTSSTFGHILENNPHIDQILYHPRKERFSELQKKVDELSQEAYDLVYDIHASLRSRWICRQLVKRSKGKRPQWWQIKKRGWERSIRIHTSWNPQTSFASQRHLMLEPLQQRSESPLNSQTELFPSEATEQKIQELLKARQIDEKQLFCIGPSASFPGKCWPFSHYRTLIAGLLAAGKEVALLGGSGEWEVQELEKEFGSKIHNFAGQFDLLESVAFLKHVQQVICNDSAIVHMAEAVQTPVLALFGPTVSEFGYAPFLESSHLMEVDLPCRPCTRNGKGECRIFSNRLCLTAISPQSVLQYVLPQTN